MKCSIVKLSFLIILGSIAVSEAWDFNLITTAFEKRSGSGISIFFNFLALFYFIHFYLFIFYIIFLYFFNRKFNDV